MKKIVVVLAVLFYACSQPLDASKVELETISMADADIPVELKAPKGAKIVDGAAPEDLLGMYTVFSKKVKGENFNVEVTCYTMEGMSLEEIMEEQKEEIKNTPGFEGFEVESENAYFFKRKEINGDLNYSFVIPKVSDESYSLITPEPKSDGNISKEEAQFMYDILMK